MKKSQLSWLCRRGLRELDVLLSNFLEKSYDQLSASDKDMFLYLLSYEDPQIFSWIFNNEKPEDVKLVSLINSLKTSL